MRTCQPRLYAIDLSLYPVIAGFVMSSIILILNVYKSNGLYIKLIASIISIGFRG